MRAPVVLLLIVAASLSACSPKPTAPAKPAFALDCGRGYEALAKDLAAAKGFNRVQESSEPYVYYNAVGEGPSYVVTQKGAPGHPAILKQEAVQVGGKKAMMTSGCPYGDREDYAKLLAYLQGLKQ